MSEISKEDLDKFFTSINELKISLDEWLDYRKKVQEESKEKLGKFLEDIEMS